MPSIEHETLVQIFQDHPELVLELVAGVVDLRLPSHPRITVESTDFADLVPVSYRADLVTLLAGSRGKPNHCIIVEPQLSRDPEKEYTWPLYAMSDRARWKCPASVVVIAPSASVARWARRTLDTGPGCTFTPIVLGPENIPAVVDPEQGAANPELALLSAMAHGRGRQGGRIAIAAMQGLLRLDIHTASHYI